MRKQRRGQSQPPTTRAGAEPEIEPDPVETDEGALDWLVEFVKKDVDRLRGGELSDLRLSAMVFSGDRLGQHEIENRDSDTWPEDEDDEPRRRRITGGDSPWKLSATPA